MSRPSNGRNELLALLAAVRDETVTDAQVTRLEQILRADDRARRFYVEFMTLHASLEQVGSTQAQTMTGRVHQTLVDETAIDELRLLTDRERQSRWPRRRTRRNTTRYLVASLVGAAALLVAVLFGYVVLHMGDSAATSATIAAIYGQVDLSSAGEASTAAAGTVVLPGQTVTTGPDAYVRLQYPDGTTVDVNASAELKLLDSADAKQIAVTAGNVYLTVQPQPPDMPLLVNPGRFDQVEVAGTEFGVDRDQAGQTWVSVTSGAVLFGLADQAVVVQAETESVASQKKRPSRPQKFDRTKRWQGLGRGLTATYYGRPDFSGESVTRIDPRIDFYWRSEAPEPAIPADHFSVRWTGKIEVDHTGLYSFYAYVDDGARLWIGDRLLIDAWKGTGGIQHVSGKTELVAGQKYDFKLEHHERKDNAKMELWWTGPATPKSIVPQSVLYPN
jgi:ferric-dicitrate binding protein FerR (iron transport regulator)